MCTDDEGELYYELNKGWGIFMISELKPKSNHRIRCLVTVGEGH